MLTPLSSRAKSKVKQKPSDVQVFHGDKEYLVGVKGVDVLNVELVSLEVEVNRDLRGVEVELSE